MPSSEGSQHSAALGSLASSLRALPRWYQLASIAAVVVPFAFSENQTLLSIVRELHFGFGTSLLWPAAYHAKLEQTSLHERLAFAAYAFVIACVLMVASKIGGKLTRYQQRVLGSRVDLDFVPGNSRRSLVITSVAVIEAAVAVREVTHGVQLRHAEGASAAAGINYHVAAQVAIMERVGAWLAVRVLLPGGLALAYRLARDLPARRVVATRWQLITHLLFRVVVSVVLAALRDAELLALAENSMTDTVEIPVLSAASSLWSGSFAVVTGWLLLTLAVVNHTFGPTGRVGALGGATVAQILSGTAVNATRCCALTVAASLAVLAVMLGVHVVELLLLWTVVILIAVWLPAAIDSFSTEMFSLVAVAAAYLRHAFRPEAPVSELLTIGAFVFALLSAASAFFVTLAFGLRSRWYSITCLAVPAAALAVHFVYTPLVDKAAIGRVLPGDVRNVAVGFVSSSLVRTTQSRLTLATALLSWAVAICASITTRVANRRSARSLRRFSPRGTRVILTYATLTRKLLHTAVTLTLLGLSHLASSIVVAAAVPPQIPAVGHFALRGIMFCIALGILMELRDVLLLNALRAVGFSTQEAAEDIRAASSFSPPRQPAAAAVEHLSPDDLSVAAGAAAALGDTPLR